MMKTRLWYVVAVFGVVATILGCALQPQNLRIDPPVKVTESAIGNSKIIGLEVSDARTDKKLGEVGDPNTKMVDVSVEEDPSPAVYERLQEALGKLGFSVAPHSDATERTLQVQIRSLELKSVKTPFTFETELRAALGAHAANGPEYYDRQFNVRTRRDGAAPPFEKDSNLLVNTAVSQALEDMLADDQLLELLAK
ncbi:MAG TPA: YajG family lipoprotein [Burkholderiales bacterium]|nr:YajG family lipoprotein [Burkholderiales bacterium]